MKRMFVWFGTCALASTAMAQSFNVDVNNTTGAGAGVPSLGYGAAAGALMSTQSWFNMASGSSFNLGSGVTCNWTGGTMTLFSFQNTGTLGNDELLMDDLYDIGGAGQSRTATLTGLANGTYRLWIYAWAPDSADFRTNVTVGSSTQSIGGAWSGGFVQGVTHAFFDNIVVSSGTLSFTAATGSGFGSLNGFQIYQIPAPSAVALLGLAGCCARRRRA